jgi:hypothetical protein
MTVLIYIVVYWVKIAQNFEGEHQNFRVAQNFFCTAEAVIHWKILRRHETLISTFHIKFF